METVPSWRVGFCALRWTMEGCALHIGSIPLYLNLEVSSILVLDEGIKVAR